MIKFLISILIFLSFNYSQNNEIKISDISVTGNDLMLEQDIINFSGLSKESFINAIEIQNAINRLWLLNKFSNIQLPLNYKKKKSDYIIINNFKEKTVKNKIKIILNKIL